MPRATVAKLWKTAKTLDKQRLANGCFLAKLLIFLLVSEKKPATMGRLLNLNQKEINQ